MVPESVLSLRGYGVAFGEKVVLSSIDLDVPERMVTVLLGPSGTGKSALLRTLAGFNDNNPNLRKWGAATLSGRPLQEGNMPALMSQSARLLMSSVLENIVHDLPERCDLKFQQQRELAERLLVGAGLPELTTRLDEPVINLTLGQQRHLAIMRLAASGASLLCMDEPTTGLRDEEADHLLDYIAGECVRRTMLVVLHNLAHASRIGGNIVLIAGGVVQEQSPGSDFFLTPKSTAARSFVRTGSCSVPSPDSRPEELDPEVPSPSPLPVAAREYISDSFGPRGFLWLKKGRLAGTPRPGIVNELDYDLNALKRVGVTCLVSLTQRAPEVDEMHGFGLENVWEPIPDMCAPSITQAVGLCRMIEQRLKQGEVLAVHCRAGLGRTGTILATYLIWEGMDALGALETVRRIEPRWVQSEQQMQFLENFAAALARRSLSSQSIQAKAL